MHKLVFLPGASGSQSFWHPLLNQLPEYTEKKIITYPGFDGVKNDPHILNFEDFQHSIHEQIANDSVVIAQSMGGVLALNTVLMQTQKIKALILLATSGGFDLSGFNCHDWRENYVNQYPDVPLWFINHQDCFSHEQIESIQLPVLLIWGDQDLLSSVQVGEFLQQHLGNAELKIIHNADHFFANTHAKEVAELIQQFLLQRVA